MDPDKSARIAAFLTELATLCERHGLVLNVNMRDNIIVWPMFDQRDAVEMVEDIRNAFEDDPDLWGGWTPPLE